MRCEINLSPEKWRLIAKVTTLNALLVAIIVILIHFFGNISPAGYKSSHPPYFTPLSWQSFIQFFWTSAWQIPLFEESLYRGPIWLLSATGLASYEKKYHLGFAGLIWASILIPNYFWLQGHAKTPLLFPIFIAGISWAWLVLKTRSLWPAVVAHSLSNLSIYFALQTILFFLRI